MVNNSHREFSVGIVNKNATTTTARIEMMAGGPEVMLKVMFPALKLNRRNPTKTLTALSPMLIFLLGGEKLDGRGPVLVAFARRPRKMLIRQEVRFHNSR